MSRLLENLMPWGFVLAIDAQATQCKMGFKKGSGNVGSKIAYYVRLLSTCCPGSSIDTAPIHSHLEPIRREARTSSGDSLRDSRRRCRAIAICGTNVNLRARRQSPARHGLLVGSSDQHAAAEQGQFRLLSVIQRRGYGGASGHPYL